MPPGAARHTAAQLSIRSCTHDDPRHRRRRLHRQQLRARLAGARRRAGRQPRRADLRRQPARTWRRCDGDARHVFVQGDIGDRAAGRPAAGRAPAARGRALRGREPRRPQHPRPGRRSCSTNVVGTFTPARGGARATGRRSTADAKAAFRFLHVSTDEVYGSLAPDATRPSPKTHAYEPNSPYSASKAASDHLVRAWHHTYGLPVLTTNCSNNYGPYQFPEKLIPLMIVNALAGKPLPVYGDGHAGARLALRAATTAARSARVLAARPASARPTTSAAGTRSPTSRSCTPSARCSTSCGPTAAGTLRAADHLRRPTGPATTAATPSTRARSSASSAGGRPRPSRPASARRCSGTSTTPTGSRDVQSGAYRDWVATNYAAATAA